MKDWHVFVRMKDGSIEGEITNFSQLDVIMRRRDVGTWSIKLPPSGLAEKLREPGSGIILEREDLETPVFTGFLNENEPTISEDESFIVCSGFSDNRILWDHLVYPGSVTFSPGTTRTIGDSYDVRTGKAETVLKLYARRNLLSSTRMVYGLPPVGIAPDLQRGSTVTGRGRFQFLGDLMQELAVAGGDLSFDVINRVFDVSVPTNRSAEQVFSFESGNLKSYAGKITAPTATDVLVAGGGELEERVVARRRDTAAEARWGRHIEVLVDRRDTIDTTELLQTADQTLTERAEVSAIDVRAIDRPNREYGKDWNLGDYVTMEDIVSVVRQVQITLDENGETITPTLDSITAVSAQSTLRVFDAIRRLQRQVNDLQRTQ